MIIPDLYRITPLIRSRLLRRFMRNMRRPIPSATDKCPVCAQSESKNPEMLLWSHLFEGHCCRLILDHALIRASFGPISDDLLNDLGTLTGARIAMRKWSREFLGLSAKADERSR